MFGSIDFKGRLRASRMSLTFDIYEQMKMFLYTIKDDI